MLGLGEMEDEVIDTMFGLKVGDTNCYQLVVSAIYATGLYAALYTHPAQHGVMLLLMWLLHLRCCIAAAAAAAAGLRC
jgi:hypothetical protein